ncbi:uncharacterized protein N7511_001429 [Penicillium nucicola]|uniref:uncharacterized protein n=1 Tax=Penicillium nucicola TaxID=1850975 RepID=UPI0025458870|nr:uncharacterized protein N7511_001429 [Penicillium nucicola]KAJ5776418.1 hypothetical protein N7511_001429 [Penicillium nucicola]
MAECEPPPVPDHFSISDFSTAATAKDPFEPPFLPYWARYESQCAQNLLDYSDEPIEYDHDDEDYSDNCFFFPEDCSYTPTKNWVEAHFVSVENTDDIQVEDYTSADQDTNPDDTTTEIDTDTDPDTDTDTDTMIPGLPDIKMIDSDALSDLLEDNLSPPEITTIIVFATNGAVFAHGSTLSSRQLRNLSATYGAAYTCYAKTASTGNLTGVNPASHPSSYITAKSMSLGDVGSIVFELDDSVAVVTRIADKVLIAAVGPSKPGSGSTETPATANTDTSEHGPNVDLANGNGNGNATTSPDGSQDGQRTPTLSNANPDAQNGHLDQHEIDRSVDLERLSSLNLSASPAVLLALESKCAALARFLGQKLDDLESPEDF